MTVRSILKHCSKSVFPISKEKNIHSVSYMDLFKYATKSDKLYAIFGITAAILNGFLIPMVLMLYGQSTNAFVSTTFCELFKNNVSLFCPAEVNEGNINDLYYKCNFSSLSMTRPKTDMRNIIRKEAIIMSLIGFVTWVLSWIQMSTLAISAEKHVYNLQRRLFNALLRKDISWHDKNNVGQINSYLVDNITKFKGGVGDKVGLIAQALMTGVACVCLGFWQSWKITLVILASSPVLGLSSALMTKVVTKSTNLEIKAYAEAGSVAQEAISNIRTVHAFNGIKKIQEKYEALLDNAKREGIVKGTVNGIALAFLWFVIFCIYALGFWYGGKLNREENLSIGVIFVAFFCIQTAVFNIGSTSPHYHSVIEAKSAACDMYDIIEERSSIENESESEEKEIAFDSIHFKNVSFCYPTRPEIRTLYDFNLTIRQGQTVAIVGESGSGKSTVIQLLLRFYDVDVGSLCFDDTNIRSINVSALRKTIGVVSQEPVLFSSSIADNIRLGDYTITDEQIRDVCKMSNAMNFIENLPDKYETFVGESGAQLSGGQKQRIAIARALIRNPKILLLDEATSALDSESEKCVQDALEIASKGRTTIVIAHRLSTIRNADVIVTMNQGAIVEYGTHDELMKRRGIYYNMFNAQSGYESLKMHNAPIGDYNRRGSMRKYAESEASDVDIKGSSRTDKICSLLYVMKLNSAEKLHIIFGCIACAIWGFIQTSSEVYFAKMISVFSHCNVKQRERLLNSYCVLYVIFGIISFVCQCISGYTFAVSGERLTKRLRMKLFKHILRREISFFDEDRNSVGALCTMLATEASAVQGATGIRLGVLLSNFSILGVSVLIAFYYGWQLCLVVIAFLPFLIISGVVTTEFTSGFTTRNKKLMEKVGKIANEVFSNIRVVKQLGKEDYFLDEYTKMLAEVLNQNKKKFLINGFLLGLSQAVICFAIAAGYYTGAVLVEKRKMTTEQMLFVFGCLVFGAMNVGQTLAMAPDHGKAVSATKKIYRLMKSQPEIDSLSTNGLMLPEVKGRINFEHVTFQYPSRPEITVLDDLNLTIPPLAKLALIGSSGCGKSTIIQLLERYYEPTYGEILLDGVNIKELNIQWYRQQLSVVVQEPILFNWSIAENIAFGDTSRNISFDEIKKVCKISNIDKFIETLPEGYNTVLGTKGTLISGGQKQRIAIARALIRNPKILLLDEATSALDAESENMVQEALDKVFEQGQGCISIAHRLSTIKNCDPICVLDSGRVIEKGKHDELISKEGLYYYLYMLSS